MAKVELGERAAKRELAILKFVALMGGFILQEIYYEFADSNVDTIRHTAIYRATVVDLESDGLISHDNAQFTLTQAGADFLKAQEKPSLQGRKDNGTSRNAKQADASSD